MSDLTPDQVQVLLKALDLEAKGEDLAEITYRINAAQEVLTSLEDPHLDTAEPLPVFWLQDEGPNG